MMRNRSVELEDVSHHLQRVSDCARNIVGDVPQHEHAGDIANSKSKIIKAKIVKKATKIVEKPATIISGALRGILSPVTALLPKPVSLARTVSRVRVRANPEEIMNPTTRGELILSESLKHTHNGELFLIHDSEGGKKRFLMFSTKKNLNYLTTCSQWLADGTFRVVPEIFSQLYTLHGFKNDKCLPLVHILASNKSKHTYCSFLRVLKKCLPNFSPARIMVDFEIGFIESFKEISSSTKISGCNFHFSQSVWRRIQSSGLQSKYNTDLEFALNMRLLLALAFVPADDVISAYEEAVSSDYFDRHSDILDELLTSFEMSWIGKLRHNKKRRKKPLFDLKLWNCYLAVLDDQLRSNNPVEGWHHGFNNRVEVSHASISRFINCLKDEQVNTELLITQMNSGLNVAPRARQAYRDYNSRLKLVVSNYDRNNKLLYLNNIAKILRMS
ncbi:uncharacterized protein LOC130667181 [Microplitis mediator]|uniref:uncharacterized protein LOC130667181 n=1 Tax=Microplitis mediator TaxID=375433 RepID=UPI002553CDBB|nr:uncharacterized protein LOC130667181 [Microplitis mediator]